MLAKLQVLYDVCAENDCSLAHYLQHSIRAFKMLGVECLQRRHANVILKVVVKHFFIEEEVTSTLLMDSLYSGLKALEGQTVCKKGRFELIGG